MNRFNHTFSLLMRSLGIILLCCLLTHCSIFSPVPHQQGNIYELSLPSPPCQDRRHQFIYVAPMQTYPGLNTSGMRYSIKPYEINYFSKNRWVASPTDMLQPLLVTHLQQVFTDASTLQLPNTRLTLKTTLEEFEQVFLGSKSEFHLTMHVEIVQEKTGKTLTSTTLCLVEPVATATPYGGVIAANKTVDSLFNKIDYLIRQASP
ncbi:MAG: membrane integrity-associated transporter subunit PqiC [Gammaproteobacteria bacterium]|nr:membrane integrity-associated transporter subunit PqiC [Gammaproteobacteria bacterium]